LDRLAAVEPSHVAGNDIAGSAQTFDALAHRRERYSRIPCDFRIESLAVLL